MATKTYLLIIITILAASLFFFLGAAAPLNGACTADTDCDLPYACVKPNPYTIGSCQPKSCFFDSDCRDGSYCYKENPLQATGICKITPSCTEAWVCTDWSQCTNGQQTRTCRDLNNCGTTNNKPAEARGCTTNICSNGVCEEGETSSNCPSDCGTPSAPSGTSSRGNSDPGSHTWFYNASSTDIWNELLQIKVSAGQANEDISLIQITLQAFGTGDDANDISKVEVYADLNNNGQVNAEPRIGVAQPAYDSDNGEKTFALNYNVQKGDTKLFVIAYVMNANAPIGRTYYFTVKEIIAIGRSSGTVFKIGGLPITSGIKTVVSPPQPPQQQACAGTPMLLLTQNPAEASQQVNAAISGLSNCIGFLATVIDANKVIACQTNLWNGADGSCIFNAPNSAGAYTYLAFVDKNQNNNIDIGEVSASVLNVNAQGSSAGVTGQQNVELPEGVINSPAEFEQAQTTKPEKILPPTIPRAGKQPINKLLAAVAVIAGGAAAYFYTKTKKAKKRISR